MPPKIQLFGFLLGDNSYETICVYLALLRMRSVAVLIKPDLHETLLHNLIMEYEPDYIIGKQIRFHLEFTSSNYRDLNIYETNFSNQSMNQEIALLLTTSGSTGSPKFAKISYHNLEANTQSIIKGLGIQAGDRAITTLPLFYTYGLSIVNTHLACGASVIINTYSLTDKRFWNLVTSKNATTFGGVPYTYQILKKIGFHKLELPSLRYLTQAGGKLTTPFLEYFYHACREKNIEFIVMYGQVEATARISYLPWNDLPLKMESVGISIPDGAISIFDENKEQVVEPHVPGEIVYEGPNVMLGYANTRNDLYKKDELNGVLWTGNIGMLDEDGYLYLVGRKNRFIKVNGHRISLDEIENLVEAELGQPCACVGEENKIILYITKEEPLDHVKRFFLKTLHISPLFLTLQYISELPRNEAGKIQYKLLN